MKTHPTDSMVITINDRQPVEFIIPLSARREVMTFLKSLQNGGRDSVAAEEALRALDKTYSDVGAALCGLRYRDNLTQVALAKKLGVPQSHISQMEHSKRPIGKKMAQRLAKIFKTDYRMFL